MTKPIKADHLGDCVAWWGGNDRQGRVEGPRAWKVSADEIKARGYNLDIKNPHTVEEELGDPEELLIKLQAADAEVVRLREKLKSVLAEALMR